MLILQVGSNKFPIKTLQEADPDQFNTIQLSFFPGSDEEIQKNLSYFVKTIKEMFNEGKIKQIKQFIKFEEFEWACQIPNLKEGSLQAMFNNPEFIDMLHDEAFLQLIVSTEEIAQQALKNERVLSRLNQINHYQDKQTFNNSCTARACLRVLLESGKIKKEEYTRSKELEIYKQIWISPAQTADPIKLIEFLKKNGINTIGVEIDSILKTTIEKSTVSGPHFEPRLRGLYSLFKSNFDQTNYKTLTVDALKEKDFPKGEIILLFIKSNPAHTVFAKNGHNKFEIFDPGSGESSEYQSFNDFAEKNKFFTGIYMELSKNKM